MSLNIRLSPTYSQYLKMTKKSKMSQYSNVGFWRENSNIFTIFTLRILHSSQNCQMRLFARDFQTLCHYVKTIIDF